MSENEKAINILIIDSSTIATEIIKAVLDTYKTTNPNVGMVKGLQPGDKIFKTLNKHHYDIMLINLGRSTKAHRSYRVAKKAKSMGVLPVLTTAGILTPEEEFKDLFYKNILHKPFDKGVFPYKFMPEIIKYLNSKECKSFFADTKKVDVEQKEIGYDSEILEVIS